MKGGSALKKNDNREISFLGKIILFFREIFDKIKEMRLPERIVEREKKNAGYEGEDSPKESKISFILGMSRLFAFSALCLILVGVLIFGGSIISYDKVYYMVKDISYINSFNETRPTTLSYSRPFSNQDFAVFKNGLTVAGDGEIKFFTSTGRVTMSQGSDFTNPKICSSNSSVLVYDQGRYDFKVYNSFVSVYSERLDYPISSADMASDGSFCVVTKSETYASVVLVYDEKQRLETAISRNDYVISVDMSDNGRYIAVVSLDASGGESVTTLTVFERGKTNSKSSVWIRDELPYTASFITNDRIALICADASYVYDLNGRQQSHTEYSSTLADFALCDGGFALLFRDNSIDSGYTLTVYGDNGNRISTNSINAHVSDVEMQGNYVYLLLDGEVRRIDKIFGTFSRVGFNAEDGRLVVFSDGEVMACTNTSAYYISFN